MKKLLVIFFLLTFSSAEASHKDQELRKCQDYLKEKNIAYIQVKNMDEVSVSFSLNQINDSDLNPGSIGDPGRTYSERRSFFKEWKTYNNAILKKRNYDRFTDIYIDNRLTFTIERIGFAQGYLEHDITWYDKNGNIWKTYGGIGWDINNLYWNCTLSNGYYSDKSLSLYRTHNRDLDKYWAAEIIIKKYYKKITPEF